MKKNISKTLVVLSFGLVIIGSIYVIINSNNNSINSEELQKEKTYSGPSEREQEDADSNKDNVVKRQNLDNSLSKTNPQNIQSVNPVITNASQIDRTITINAYVANIFENGGTCTATIVLGNSSIQKKSNANTGARTTDCEPIRIDRSEFSQVGDWTVTIEYISPKASGISPPLIIKVQ